MTTCLVCANVIPAWKRGHYCSARCMQKSYDRFHSILRYVRQFFFDPIYQAVELNLTPIPIKRKYVRKA